MTEYVCSFCLKPDTIRESVTLHGCSEKVNIVASDSEKFPGPRAIQATRPERATSWDSVDGEGFYCTNCEASFSKLEDMVILRPLFECRSCGWSGSNLDEHLDNCPETPERVDPAEVNPGQETLT